MDSVGKRIGLETTDEMNPSWQVRKKGLGIVTDHWRQMSRMLVTVFYI